jgi:hypothetical protein
LSNIFILFSEAYAASVWAISFHLPAHLCAGKNESGNAVSFLAPLVESGRRTADLWPPVEEKTQSPFGCGNLFIWNPSGNLLLPCRLLNGTGKADFRQKKVDARLNFPFVSDSLCKEINTKCHVHTLFS